MCLLIFKTAIIILLIQSCVHGEAKWKRDRRRLDELTDVTAGLSDEELEAGLRTLTTEELHTLSEFVERQSEKLRFEDEAAINDDSATMDSETNYVGDTNEVKKKRTIEDLYDELAQENTQLIKENKASLKPNLNEPLENCGCMNKEPQIIEENMRAKRENQIKPFQTEYDVNEYIRELEDSFPRDQGEKSQLDFNGHTEHVRIKRLKQLKKTEVH